MIGPLDTSSELHFREIMFQDIFGRFDVPQWYVYYDMVG